MKYNLKNETQKWVEETYEKLKTKLSAECDRIGTKIPYIAEEGVYKENKAESDIIWWTNGFWPGMVWLRDRASGGE